MAVAETYGSLGLSTIQSGGKADAVFTRGVPRRLYERASVLAADDDGSIYILGMVNSDDIPLNWTLLHGTITSGTDYDIGLYDIATDGTLGTVVDKDIFADGLDLSSGTSKNALTTIHGTLTNHGKRVWEMLGLAADPGKKYFVAATANTVGSAAGTLVLLGEVLNVT